MDDLSLPSGSIVRHEHCQPLLSCSSSAVRCLACSDLRASFMVKAACTQHANVNRFAASNYVNHRYIRQCQGHNRYNYTCTYVCMQLSTISCTYQSN